MECTVYTRCGAYTVHFKSDGESEFLLQVQGGERGKQSSERYTASLTERDVSDITESAGVRKSFHAFAEMTYRALIGSSPCLTFFVESEVEMQKRIKADIVQRHGDPSAPGMMKSHATSSTAITEPSSAAMFLTVDYDVDFTRAIFPLPLRRNALVGSEIEDLATQNMPCKSGGAVTTRSSSSEELDHKKNLERTQHLIDKQHLAEALRLIQVLNGENATLKRENVVLASLSREKMREMQQLFKTFEEGAAAIAEVKKLREKNVRLRMELDKTREREEVALASLERWKRRSDARPNSYRHSSASPLRSRDVNQMASTRPAAKRASRLNTPPPAAVPRGRSTARPRGRLDSPDGSAGASSRLAREYEALTSFSAAYNPRHREALSSKNGRLSEEEQGAQPRRLVPRARPRRTNSASSRGSSRSESHERLYYTSTVASRERETQRSAVGRWREEGRPVFRS